MQSATQRVIDALQAAGVAYELREFAESTHTSAEAAAAIGVTVAQIVKSLIFTADGAPILVLASGGGQVDTTKLALATQARIKRADADVARAATGFTIGGVPPIGLATTIAVYMDQALLQFDQVWAAAGTPHAVFSIAPADLERVCGAQVIDVAKGAGP